MRNNNFLKIFVSLVMCLTLVLSLVACGGNEGKDGKDGKDGVDGVGISSVTYEDGKLVIKYTNDKTDSFDLAVEGAACDHKYSEPVELVAHAMNEDGTFVNGTYLRVCGECGAAAVKDEVNHKFENKPVPATCIAYGYTADVCVCGYETNKVVGTEYAEHTMTTKGFVALEGKTICVDGGTLLQYCTYCKLTAQTETEGIGHKVEQWNLTKTNEPTISKTGLLTGVCAQCSADVEEVLPALNAEDYECDVIKAKVDCSDVGEADYTYTFEGQKFVIKGDIASTSHVLAGVAADTLAWEINGETVYDVNIAGIKLMAGQTLACETVMSSAYYMCEACDTAVAVKAYRCHAGTTAEDSETVAATCTTTGSKVVAKCTYCQGENVAATIPATGHDFAYSVVVATSGADKGKVTAISKVCGNENCTFTQAVTFVGEASYKELKAATCVAKGEAELTYKPSEAAKAVTVKVATAYANHKLNDVFVNASEAQDSAIAGVKLFAGETLAACEDTANGYFMCDVCAEAVAVTVIKNHTVLTWTWDKDDDDAEMKPTCSTPGQLVGKCTAENCGEEVTKEVEPTGEHELTYSFELVEGDDYLMSFDCAGCDLEDYNKVDVPVTGVKTVVVKSTCSVQGTKTYSYKNEDGKTVTAVEKLPLADHTLNGKAVASNVLDYDLVPGLKLFAGTKISCKTGETNSADGYYFCEACGEAVSVTVVKNHRGTWSWTEKNEDGTPVVPTCTTGADREMAECLDCGEKEIPDTVDALGHTYAPKFNAYINADKKLAGSITLVCTVCDYVDEVVGSISIATIPELNLELDDADSVVKATCKAAGYATFVVEGEGEEYTIVASIAQLDHTAQKDLKSTSNIFVISGVNDKDETFYYAVFECETCGDFFKMDNTGDFDFDSTVKADVETAVAEFKAYLAEEEAKKADK